MQVPDVINRKAGFLKAGSVGCSCQHNLSEADLTMKLAVIATLIATASAFGISNQKLDFGKVRERSLGRIGVVVMDMGNDSSRQKIFFAKLVEDTLMSEDPGSWRVWFDRY